MPIRKSHVERLPDIETKESRLRDTDDAVRHSFDGQRPAYRIGRPAEATLPETVADDGDRASWSTAAAIVIVGQQSAMNRPDTKGAEVGAADPETGDEVRRAAVREIHARAVRRERIGKRDRRTVPDLFPDRVRQMGPSSRETLQQRQLIWSDNWQRPQEQTLKNGEDRGVGADAKGERKNRDDRDDGRRLQRPPGVAKVLNQLLSRPPSPTASRVSSRMRMMFPKSRVAARWASRADKPSAARASVSSERWNWISSSSSRCVRRNQNNARRPNRHDRSNASALCRHPT